MPQEPARPGFGRPQTDEAASYYFRYIDRVESDDVVGVLESQLDDTLAFLGRISEDESLRRYAAEKWSPREVLSHVNDTERLFVSRAFWFARAFDSPLPSYDQDQAVAQARSDSIPWSRHVEEFRAVRLATQSFFRNLPAEAWPRRGIASGNPFSVRALAYIAAGHVDHHRAILRDRYGLGGPRPQDVQPEGT